MLYVAEEARALMASLGIRSMPEMTGQTHLLDPTLNDTNWKTRTLDLRPLLAVPPIAEGRPKGFVSGIPFKRRESANSFDLRLLVKRYEAHKASDPEFANPLVVDSTVTNGDLAVGGTLSNRIVSDHGPDGLPEGSIEINLKGSAGQTVGAWLAGGVEMSVEGDVNDYAGKGLSGGVLAVYPAGESHFEASKNVIAGNVALYGATARPRLLRGPRRRALRGPQLGRADRRRGRRRARLRVHDRRHRRRHRPDRPELRRRHERWLRLRPQPGPATRRPHEPPARRPRSG